MRVVIGRVWRGKGLEEGRFGGGKVWRRRGVLRGMVGKSGHVRRFVIEEADGLERASTLQNQ